MRKLYVPITMDNEHSTELYNEDFKKLGVDHLFLAECSRLVHMDDERYAKAIENIRKHIEIYEGLGYECGVWISTIGYGAPLFSTAEGRKSYTSIRSIVGRDGGDAICPTDKTFVEKVCKNVTDLARAGAKMIMLDDELCLSVRPGLGCACDNHLAEFSRRIGRKVTLEELPKLLFTGEANEERKVWLEMQGDTLRSFCRTLREALDKVDPTVRMGYCAGYTSWDVEGVDAIELTHILAGNTRPFLRFTSAPYWFQAQRFGQTPMATFIEFARMQAAWVKDEDIDVFTECDTYPPVAQLEELLNNINKELDSEKCDAKITLSLLSSIKGDLIAAIAAPANETQSEEPQGIVIAECADDKLFSTLKKIIQCKMGDAFQETAPNILKGYGYCFGYADNKTFLMPENIFNQCYSNGKFKKLDKNLTNAKLYSTMKQNIPLLMYFCLS